MMNKRSRTLPAISVTLSCLFLYAGEASALAQSEVEDSVKAFVERFLLAMGEGDLEALPAMFVPDANIGIVSLRDGSWATSTLAFDAWLAGLRERPTWTRFREPVSEFTVHVGDSMMAFVRADATLFVGEQARSHNIDYFTLVRVDGAWKFLSASYVAKPLVTE